MGQRKRYVEPVAFCGSNVVLEFSLLYFHCLQVQAYNQKASILEGLGQTHDALHQLHLSLEYLPGSALCKLQKMSREVVSFGSVPKQWDSKKTTRYNVWSYILISRL